MVAISLLTRPTTSVLKALETDFFLTNIPLIATIIIVLLISITYLIKNIYIYIYIVDSTFLQQ